MKQKLVIKHRFSVIRVSLLLLSSGVVASAWAQPPGRPPVINQPRIQPPADPRRVVVVNAPTIEVPTENLGVDLTKPLVVAGTGTRDGRVDVSVKGEWTAPMRRGSQATKKTRRTLSNSTVRVAPQGDWKTDPITLNIPRDATDIKFEISAVQRIGDKTSEATVINTRPALKALPLQAPPLTTIITKPAVNITFPNTGANSTPTIIPSSTGNLALRGTAVGDNALTIVIKKTVVSTRTRVRIGGGRDLLDKYNHYTRSEQTLRDVPVKDGKWNTAFLMAPGKVQGTVTEVQVEIKAYLKNNDKVYDRAYLKSIHGK